MSISQKLLIDLAAAKLALPAPYGKTAADGATLLAEVNGDQLGADVQPKYGDQLRLLARYQQDSAQFSQVLLSLGQATAQLSPGFQIELDLPKAEFIPWLQLIRQHVTAADVVTTAGHCSVAQVDAAVASGAWPDCGTAFI